MSLLNAFLQRRTVYALNTQSPLTDDETRKLVADTLTTLPSAFNSQPVRAALLFSDAHARLWNLVLEALRAVVPAENFGPTQAKITGFANAHGSILWLCDDTVTETYAKQFPAYAANFPVWAEQAEGIAQFAVWCALRERGLGASLQHYNPLIDSSVREAFSLPPTWRLVAQMPFGAIDAIDPPPPRLPEVEVLKIFH